MPLSIPKGLTREYVLRAIAELDAGIEHSFGPPTGYELVHEGKRYAPRAVIGPACRSLLGRVLLPQEFSGGEALGQANYVLRQLGFTVLAIASSADEVQEVATRSRDRSPQEVVLFVADYFSMREVEPSGLAIQQGRAQRLPPAAAGQPVEGVGRVRAPERVRGSD
jgi:hypothetical protein